VGKTIFRGIYILILPFSNSVLGLIFLSRWTPSEIDDNILEPPEDLWYANQVWH
jgi:hypothetical protein